MNGAISVSLNLVAICLLLIIVVYVSNGNVAMNTLCQYYCASNCIVLTICSLQLSSAQVVSFSFQLKNFKSINNKRKKNAVVYFIPKRMFKSTYHRKAVICSPC